MFTTEDKRNEDQEQFYIQSVVHKAPKSDTVIIFGDLNEKFGEEQVFSNLTDKHTLQEETNRNDEMVCEIPFCK
jgi:hypothetical protein